MSEKPVGSEFPPPPLKDNDKNIGAEYMPDKPPLSQQPPQQPPQPPPYGNTTSSSSFSQQPYSSPTSPQNAYPLNPINERSLPPPPSQSGYATPQQPQHQQQQSFHQQQQSFHQQQQSFHQQQQPYQQTFQQPGVYTMQQPQMQGQMQPQQVHVINMGAPMAGVQIMSHTPVRVVCPNCNNEVTTIVTETPGSTAYLWALVLFCVFFPLMWLPCVLPGCLDKTHTCPACRYVLAYIKV